MNLHLIMPLQQRKAISVEGILDIVNWLEKGECIANVCCTLGLINSAVHTVHDNAETFVLH
jgi:hypothetical protein